jgi:hypothetical protein
MVIEITGVPKSETYADLEQLVTRKMSTFGIYRLDWLMVRTSGSFDTLRKKPFRQYTQQRQRDTPLTRDRGM